jgi:hypothetical protein
MFVDKPTPVERLVRRSLTLIAATTLFTFFSVRSAVASCGDYVMIGGHAVGGHTERDSGHSMPGVPTCRGPNCQRQMPLPVVPTKGLLDSAPVELACCSQLTRTPNLPLTSGIFERVLLLAESHSLPLLRPPCL